MKHQSHRLEKVCLSESFQALLKTKPLKKTKRLMLHCIHEASPARFGVLVPKRLAKRAVDRNTIKRLVRQACRVYLSNRQGVFLVRLRQAVDQVPYSERSIWWAELQQLFDCLSEREPSEP